MKITIDVDPDEMDNIVAETIRYQLSIADDIEEDNLEALIKTHNYFQPCSKHIFKENYVLDGVKEVEDFEF